MITINHEFKIPTRTFIVSCTMLSCTMLLPNTITRAIIFISYNLQQIIIFLKTYVKCVHVLVNELICITINTSISTQICRHILYWQFCILMQI